MTLSNPASGYAPGMPESCIKPDLSTIEGRIAACCEWFDVAPPMLTYDTEDALGGLLLDDALVTWIWGLGVSFDWLVVGDPCVSVAEARRLRLQERQTHRVCAVIRQLDPVEQSLLLAAMRASQDDGVPLEQALEDCTKAVEAHRAEKARISSEWGK